MDKRAEVRVHTLIALRVQSDMAPSHPFLYCDMLALKWGKYIALPIAIACKIDFAFSLFVKKNRKFDFDMSIALKSDNWRVTSHQKLDVQWEWKSIHGLLESKTRLLATFVVVLFMTSAVRGTFHKSKGILSRKAPSLPHIYLAGPLGPFSHKGIRDSARLRFSISRLKKERSKWAWHRPIPLH